jgi:hypothetical protein
MLNEIIKKMDKMSNQKTLYDFSKLEKKKTELDNRNQKRIANLEINIDDLIALAKNVHWTFS